jgi:hypothetical protein
MDMAWAGGRGRTSPRWLLACRHSAPPTSGSGRSGSNDESGVPLCATGTGMPTSCLKANVLAGLVNFYEPRRSLVAYQMQARHKIA